MCIRDRDYSDLSNKYANILRTGDIKFQANLEYRPRIWGDLYGAPVSYTHLDVYKRQDTRGRVEHTKALRDSWLRN